MNDDVLRKQPVRADEDVDLPRGRAVEDLLRFLLRAKAVDHVDGDRKAGEAIAQRLDVLKRQHRRRSEHRHLFAVHDRLERGAHRDLGLAVADVAAEQPVHRRGRLHVFLDVGDRARLVGRQLVRKRVLEFLLPVRVWRECVARHGLSLGVELEQLLGHVAHRLLDARLGLLPGRAAEAIEGGTCAARVLLDEVEPLNRDEQLVVARVAQFEKLLRIARGAWHRPAHGTQLLQSDELADAVIDVHDEIADLQIAKVGEKRVRDAAPLLRRAPLFLEDVGLRVNLQARILTGGTRATRSRPR